MKRLLASLMILVIITCMSYTSIFAVNADVDGYSLTGNCFIDSEGRTMAPVRALAEGMGCEVGWNDETQVVSISKDLKYSVIENSSVVSREDKCYLELSLGSNKIYKNYGESVIEMDTTAQSVDGSTYVPLRYVAEALGGEVIWVEETSSITIRTPQEVYGVQVVGPYIVPNGSTVNVTATDNSSYIFSASKEDDMMSVISDMKSIMAQKKGPKLVEAIASAVVNQCWVTTEELEINVSNNTGTAYIFNYDDGVSVVLE